MLAKIRKRFDAAVSRRIDDRLRSIEIALEEQGIRNQEARLRSDDYDARLGGTQADFDFLRSEFDRLAPQLAALESRLEDFAQSGEASAIDETSALSLARREHERAKIRLELVAHYEERLRRLESQDV